MALTITNLGTGSNTTSAATATVSSVTASVNDVVKVTISAANSGTGGAACISSVTDSAGNTYTQRSLVNQDPGAADAGTTLGVYESVLTTALSAGTITVNFSPNCLVSSIVAQRIQAASGYYPRWIERSGSTLTGDGNSFTFTTSSLTSGDVVFACLSCETDDTFTPDSDTTNGNWSTAYTNLVDLGGDVTCQFVVSQHKIITGTGTQTWNASTGGATRDYAMDWHVYRETAITVAATANNITTGTPIVGTPAATITVNATPNNITSGASVAGTPAATVIINAIANDITSGASVAGTPSATITVNAVANSITSGAFVAGTPAATVTGPGIYLAGQASSTTSNTSLEITPITAGIGDMLVIVVASDNSGTGGANALSGFADTSGNVYDNYLNSVSSSGGVANDGVVLTVCQVPVTVAMNADTITVSYSTATVHKVATVYRAEAEEGNELHCTIGGSSAGSSSTQSRTATIDGGRTVFGVVALESDDTVTLDSDTTNSTWSGNFGGLADTGADEDAIQLVTQFKTVTATGSQTYNTSTSSARDYAMRLVTVYETLATVNAVANDITSGAAVAGTPSATVIVNAVANDILAGAAVAGTPAATIGSDANAIANDVTTGQPILGTPAATVTVNATADNASSGSPVAGTPEAVIVVNATANGIEAGTPIVGTPSASIAVAASPNDITCGTPLAGTPVAVIVCSATPDSITTGTPLAGTPEAEIGQVVNATANDVTTGAAIAGTPVAAVTVNATATNATSGTPIAGSPVALMVISATPDSIDAGSPVAGSPVATITINAVADAIYAGTPIAGTPAASITINATANDIICGVPFFAWTALRTICIDRSTVYAPGNRQANVYSPGTRSSDVYANGQSSDTIYSPGAVADTYAPGSPATQVGCHQ